MPSVSPLKKLINWLQVENEEDDERDGMDTPQMTSSVPQVTSTVKRQRGPLTLHGGQEGGMEIRHPRTLDDRMSIGMDLKQRRMVTLDLTQLPESDARYFLEFVYGVVFALDATAEKVTEGIYLLAPRGVSVRNDSVAEEPSPKYYAASAVGAAATSRQEELFWQGR